MDQDTTTKYLIVGMAGTFSLDRTFDGSDEENGEIDLYEI